DLRGGGFLGPVDRHQRLDQRVLQELVDVGYRDDREAALHIVRDLGEILLVLARDEHRLEAAAQRREQLLLEAADRQYPAAQRDLAGHGDIAADRDAGQDRD